MTVGQPSTAPPSRPAASDSTAYVPVVPVVIHPKWPCAIRQTDGRLLIYVAGPITGTTS